MKSSGKGKVRRSKKEVKVKHSTLTALMPRNNDISDALGILYIDT